MTHGVPGGSAVEVGEDDQDPARPHPPRRRPLHTPSRANRLPTVSGMLQAKSSLKTKGVAARYTMTEPPMMVAISTPKEAPSARPSTALPRVTTRSRQSISELNSPVIIQANSREGAVRGSVEPARHQEDSAF